VLALKQVQRPSLVDSAEPIGWFSPAEAASCDNERRSDGKAPAERAWGAFVCLPLMQIGPRCGSASAERRTPRPAAGAMFGLGGKEKRFGR
jgi:hypothetical protein